MLRIRTYDTNVLVWQNPETTGLALDLLKDHRMKDMVVASEEQKFLEIGFVYEEAAFVRIW